MNYSIHTMELLLELDTKKFNKLLETAYKNAKDSHKVYRDGNIIHDYALLDEGIKIEYHDDTYKKKIRLIVNPTKVLGGDDVKKLWKPNDVNISIFLDELKAHIKDYFDSEYKLKDFELNRIDFTVNIDVESRETVSDYIKILHNIRKVKCFEPKYSENDEHIDKNLSFDLEGRSNGIEFTAYDKEGAIRQKEEKYKRKEFKARLKDAEGILRIEIRLKKKKAIRKYTEEKSVSDQIKNLALNSKGIFLSIFADIVPCGDHYKKKEAVKLIEDSELKKKHKEKMLELVDLIHKKKSIYLAQKEMKDRNIKDVFLMFAKINVSPVTISKRHDIKHLKNLYAYLNE